jgi:hypothetical protein
MTAPLSRRRRRVVRVLASWRTDPPAQRTAAWDALWAWLLGTPPSVALDNETPASPTKETAGARGAANGRTRAEF